MTTDASRRAALDTTEILENALSHLPNRTVFGVQRVCRQWKDVIAASPAIQEKLFLRLRGQTETWMLTNPISIDNFTIYFEPRTVERNFRMVSDAELKSGEWRKESGRVEHLFTPTTLNPLLRPQEGISNYWIEESPAFYVDLRPTANFAQHNSFRATYLTDPPCKECVVYINFAARPARPGFRHIGSTVVIKRRHRPGIRVAGCLD
jgi:hypothetical protein